jgi:EAL domain-containing protein (putative c-di-GMP-specific phosphodiesterase class I)
MTSLNYLHQLPVDMLKIDPMFVRSLGKDPNALLLIKGMLALSNGLGMSAIAEGVETENQLKSLQQLGCTQAQGYFFSAPLQAKNLNSLLGKSL